MSPSPPCKCTLVPEPPVVPVLAHEARQQALLASLRDIDAACRVELACTAIGAAAILPQGHVHLLVIDLQLEPGQPLSLIHLLARLAPSTALLAFGGAASRLPITPYAVWCWDDMSLVLRRSLQALRPDSGDTPADPVLDALVRSAASVLDCPIALVSLVDESRQWFKARTGLVATQTPREPAFCAHTILGDGLFVVPDAATDPRFADNPLVTGEPHLRFYAGVPLEAGGHKIGTLCVIDHQPRQLDALQRALLSDLARAVQH